MAWLLAVGSGVLLLGAFPGTGGQAWLGFVALVPLLLALDGASRVRAAGLGFAAGTVFWLVTIGWPAPSVLRLGGVALHRGAVTVAVVVAVLSLYTAAFAALLAGVARRPAAAWVAVAACLWVAVEFLRTHLLTGFPWNLLAYSQYRTLPLIQVAAVTGVFGVSFVLVAVNAAVARALPALVAVVRVRRAGAGREAGGAAATGLAAVVVALAGGALAPAGGDTGAPFTVAIAQANIDQTLKWRPAHRDFTLRVYGALTGAGAARGAAMVVWPETAVPLFRRDDPAWPAMTAMARDTKTFVVAGVADRATARPRNSVFLLAPDGTARGRYDKRHLLPFGEYLPAPLGFLRVVGGEAVSEFTAGEAGADLVTPFARVAPLVCFEVIFPGEVRERVAAGAELLVNLTNDAWFGRSPTPVQHLAAAVFRAVENRVWLVRAANSGISAIVAPDGRIVRSSGLFTRDVLVGAVARRGATAPYTRHGDLLAWTCLGVAAGLLPLRVRRRKVEAPVTAV